MAPPAGPLRPWRPWDGFHPIICFCCTFSDPESYKVYKLHARARPCCKQHAHRPPFFQGEITKTHYLQGRPLGHQVKSTTGGERQITPGKATDGHPNKSQGTIWTCESALKTSVYQRQKTLGDARLSATTHTQAKKGEIQTR